MTETPDIETLFGRVPFYVNGTLKGDDLAAFEAALQNSEELREEVVKDRELTEAFKGSFEAEISQVGEPQPDKIQALMGSNADTSGSTDSKPSGLASALSFLNPVNWKPAVTLAIAAAAVGQAAIIGGQADTISQQGTQIAALEADNFALAAGAGSCDAEAIIMLELTNEAKWSEVTGLLLDQSLSVSRSTLSGVLMLRHPDKTANVDALIIELQKSPLVLNASKAE